MKYQSFFQSDSWQQFYGKTKVIITTIEQNKIFTQIKKLPLGFKYGYTPRVDLSHYNQQQLREFIKNQARLGFTYLAVEPQNYITDTELDQKLQKLGFQKQKASLQPQYTNIVELEPDMDKQLEKAKRNFRRYCQKIDWNKVSFRIVSDYNLEDLQTFWQVYTNVQDRVGFKSNAFEYYRRLFEVFTKNSENHENQNQAELILVYVEQKIAGVHFNLFNKNITFEMYGGLNQLGKENRITYVLKYLGLKQAIKRGNKYYDQWGTAKFDFEKGEYIQPHHLYNISQFKKLLGGEQVEFLPQYRYIYHPIQYRIYQIMIFLKFKALKPLQNLIN